MSETTPLPDEGPLREAEIELRKAKSEIERLHTRTLEQKSEIARLHTVEAVLIVLLILALVIR